MKKIAIMQPYFFPYIGYFQLINAVDIFVIYDNIKYTKKGWINRNRILSNGKEKLITLPLKKSSDYLPIIQKELSNNWEKEKIKIINKIKENYRKAPYFENVFPIIENCLNFENINLFYFLMNSINEVIKYLSIGSKIIISSELNIDHSLKSEKKVIEICKTLKAEEYLNPIGGIDLYSRKHFKKYKIDLFFLKTNDFEYNQFNNDFIQFLSIIDIMMFNSQKEIRYFLENEYSIINN